jgi:hypothetical protein
MSTGDDQDLRGVCGVCGVTCRDPWGAQTRVSRSTPPDTHTRIWPTAISAAVTASTATGTVPDVQPPAPATPARRGGRLGQPLPRLHQKGNKVTTCRHCKRSWTGESAAHCGGDSKGNGGCPNTFTSVSGFDLHRRNGECIDPTKLPRMEVKVRSNGNQWGFKSSADYPMYREGM